VNLATKTKKHSSHRQSARLSPEYVAVVTVLVAERKKTGVGQIELSNHLGKPQSYVAKIETGSRRIDVAELLAICDALELDPHELIDKLRRAIRKASQ
jgi:transcriptional regulator with XRE-family HTH domain